MLIILQKNFGLDFSVDGPDVLDNFDFEEFLLNTDDNNDFGNFDNRIPGKNTP
jgi:hypothetical protein